MSDVDFRADCARCAALCCVAFHFDRSDQFGFDKATGEPCAHLTAAGRCGIHRRRAEQGFRGCVGYDCHGAGPWVTQVLFGGRSWLDNPALLGPMAEAFLRVERARRLLVLLREARKLDLSASDRRRLRRLDAAAQRTAAHARPTPALEAEAQVFLRSLSRYLPPPSPASERGRPGQRG